MIRTQPGTPLEFRLARLTASQESRDPDRCFTWKGAVGDNGYGQIKIDGKLVPAHRAAYAIYLGDPRGFQVLHTCDNPLCVRVDHLCLGTQGDNMADMVAKKRGRVGRTHCKRGHAYDEANTQWAKPKGRAPYRKCRACLYPDLETGAEVPA